LFIFGVLGGGFGLNGSQSILGFGLGGCCTPTRPIPRGGGGGGGGSWGGGRQQDVKQAGRGAKVHEKGGLPLKRRSFSQAKTRGGRGFFPSIGHMQKP